MNTKAIQINPLKHILMYSVPAIIAMVLSSFVTIVDGYYIAKFVSKDALASINLAMPLLYVFLAITLMIGVGGSSIASRRLGAKKLKESNNVFNQTIITSLFTLTTVAVVFYLGLFMYLKNASLNSNVKDYIWMYYKVMLAVYPLIMVNIIFGMFLRAEAKHSLFMLNTIVTTILNIVLDYVFVVYFKMGITGVAISSAIAVLVGVLLMLIYFLSKKSVFRLMKYKFSKQDFKETLFNGSSELIGQLSMSITMFFLNIIVFKRLGLLGVAAITLLGYSRYIFNMIVTGFGQGCSPMISYSYGAKEFDLCKRLRAVTNKLVIGVGIVFFIAFMLHGKLYASIFTSDKSLIDLVSFAFKLFSFGFIFTGFNVITSFYFTAIGYAKESALISGARGLVFLLINMLVLPFVFGDSGVFLIATLTELFTFLLSTLLLANNKKIRQ